MKMIISKTSDWDYKEEKGFSSLQELLEFVNEQGECILIPPDPYVKKEWELEIYDDYRE